MYFRPGVDESSVFPQKMDEKSIQSRSDCKYRSHTDLPAVSLVKQCAYVYMVVVLSTGSHCELNIMGLCCGIVVIDMGLIKFCKVKQFSQGIKA